MATLPQCDAFGFINELDGTPSVGQVVTLRKVIDADGNPISLDQKTTTTDSQGRYSFNLPQNSTAYISARATTFSQCNGGDPFKVPTSTTGQLEPAFDPETGGSLVAPPLVYAGGVLSIPQASALQDGYLSADDFALFSEGMVGVKSFNTRDGDVTLTDTDVRNALGYIAIDKGGDSMQGAFVLYRTPVADMEAATKRYVDDAIAAALGTLDTTPPVISSVASGSISSSGVTITWTTDEPSDSQIEYGTTTAYGSLTTLNTSLVITHSQAITMLSPSTLYHYRVHSKDASGNPSVSADFTFTTSTGPDVTPPVISSVASGSISSSGATITWTTGEASDSQVEYGTTTSYGSLTTLDPAMVTSHSVPLTGLSGSTLYHYRVKSKDAAANLATSGDFTFTTSTPPTSLLTGIRTYWQLEGITGAGLLDSVGSYDLTPTGTLTVVTGIPAGNNAVQGAGAGSFFVADDVTQDFPPPFSVAGWIKLQSTSGPQALLTKGANTAGQYGFFVIFNAGKWTFGCSPNGSTVTQVDVTASPALNTWYFLAAVNTGSELRLSIDDGAVGTIAYSGGVHHSTEGITALSAFGALSSAAVDETGIWNRALTAAEIMTLYNSGNGLTYPF